MISSSDVALLAGLLLLASLKRSCSITFSEGCDPPCGEHTEFCGGDQQCHLLSCKNIYTFAPEAYSGNDPDTTDDDDDLVCTTTPNMEDLACDNAFDLKDTVTPWPVAVSFVVTNDTSFFEQEPDGLACRGFTADGPQGDIVLPFDRRCVARTFECYDMDPDVDRAEQLHNYTDRVGDFAASRPDGNAIGTFVYHTRFEPSTLTVVEFHVKGRNIVQKALNEDLLEVQVQSRRIVHDTSNAPTTQNTTEPRTQSTTEPITGTPASSGMRLPHALLALVLHIASVCFG